MDAASGGSLETVVADGGGLKAFFEVAAFEHVLRVIGPHSGEAIGLEFYEHREGVTLTLAPAAAQASHFLFDAEDILHVMTDFVGNHIGEGKVARSAEAFEIVEEA